jgi:hypothetical protein
MDAEISSLLRAAERLVHESGSRAARSCGGASIECTPRRGQIVRDIPSETLTCSSGFGIFRSPLHRGGKKSGSLEFLSAQRRNTDGEEKSEEGRQEA